MKSKVRKMTLLGETIKVKDAEETIDLVVTKENCQMGKRKNHGECAIALALKQKDNNLERVLTFPSRTYAKPIGSNIWIRFRNGSEIRNEVLPFDKGADFTPGNYTLHKLAGTKNSLGGRTGRDQTGRIRKPTPTPRKKPHHYISGVRARANRKQLVE